MVSAPSRRPATTSSTLRRRTGSVGTSGARSRGGSSASSGKTPTNSTCFRAAEWQTHRDTRLETGVLKWEARNLGFLWTFGSTVHGHKGFYSLYIFPVVFSIILRPDFTSACSNILGPNSGVVLAGFPYQHSKMTSSITEPVHRTGSAHKPIDFLRNGGTPEMGRFLMAFI